VKFSLIDFLSETNFFNIDDAQIFTIVFAHRIATGFQKSISPTFYKQLLHTFSFAKM